MPEPLPIGALRLYQYRGKDALANSRSVKRLELEGRLLMEVVLNEAKGHWTTEFETALLADRRIEVTDSQAARRRLLEAMKRLVGDEGV